ncbi:murein transglycosylase, partial [Ralstonia pseudosolanacearum]
MLLGARHRPDDDEDQQEQRHAGLQAEQHHRMVFEELAHDRRRKARCRHCSQAHRPAAGDGTRMTATTLDASTRAHTVHRRGWAGLSAALVAVLLAACTSGPPPRLEAP